MILRRSTAGAVILRGVSEILREAYLLTPAPPTPLILRRASPLTPYPLPPYPKPGTLPLPFPPDSSNPGDVQKELDASGVLWTRAIRQYTHDSRPIK